MTVLVTAGYRVHSTVFISINVVCLSARHCSRAPILRFCRFGKPHSDANGTSTSSTPESDRELTHCHFLPLARCCVSPLSIFVALSLLPVFSVAHARLARDWLQAGDKLDESDRDDTLARYSGRIRVLSRSIFHSITRFFSEESRRRRRRQRSNTRTTREIPRNSTTNVHCSNELHTVTVVLVTPRRYSPITTTTSTADVRRLQHVPLAMGARGRCNSVCTAAHVLSSTVVVSRSTDDTTVANAVESVQVGNKKQVSAASTLDDRTQPSEHLWILPWGPTLGAHFLPRRLPPSLCFARSALAAPLQRLPYLPCHQQPYPTDRPTRPEPTNGNRLAHKPAIIPLHQSRGSLRRRRRRHYAVTSRQQPRRPLAASLSSPSTPPQNSPPSQAASLFD